MHEYLDKISSNKNQHTGSNCELIAPLQRVKCVCVLHLAYFFATTFSLRHASCKSSVSTYSGGICMYRTTEPRTKQFCKVHNWGYRSGFTTLTLRSLTFKYWSTEWSVPVSTTSFFSSTATSFPTRVLKKEKKICSRVMQIVVV